MSDDAWQQHPLLNPIICNQIFQYLDFQDLIITRFVCKTWSQIAFRFLSNKSKIQIEWKAPRMSDYGTTLREFLGYLDNNKGRLIHRHYQLWDWEIGVRGKNDNRVRRVFEACGGFVESLTFMRCSFTQNGGLEILRRIMFEWTPNLKCVTFDKVRFGDYEKAVGGHTAKICWNLQMEKLQFIMDLNGDADDSCRFRLESVPVFPISWDELLTAYPNLKEISTDGWPNKSSSADKINSLFNLLKDKEKVLQLHTIRGLFSTYSVYSSGAVISCDGLVTNNHFTRFTQFNLPLTSISMHFPPDIEITLVNLVLSKHALYLKVVSLTSGTYDDNEVRKLFLDGTAYPKLVTLESDVGLLPTSLEFLVKMPKLESLGVTSDGYSHCTITALVQNSSLIHQFSTLKSLHLENVNVRLPTCAIEIIATRFPKLVDFEACLDDNAMQQVYSSLQNLERLSLIQGYTGFQITDYGITGLIPNASAVNTADLGQENGLGIRRLTKLQHLAIHSCDEPSDVAIYNGIIHLHSLRSLQFGENKKISDECYQLLRKRLGLRIHDFNGLSENKFLIFKKF